MDTRSALERPEKGAVKARRRTCRRVEGAEPNHATLVSPRRTL